MSRFMRKHWFEVLAIAAMVVIAGIVGATEIYGTVTNDSAPTGCVGEMVQAFVPSASAVTLSNNTAANVASINLTPGDWNVWGNVNFSSTTATGTGKSAGIAAVSATLPTDGTEQYAGLQLLLLSVTDGIALTPKPVRVAAGSTTTVYLVSNATFTLGTMKAFGSITARRAR